MASRCELEAELAQARRKKGPRTTTTSSSSSSTPMVDRAGKALEEVLVQLDWDKYMNMAGGRPITVRKEVPGGGGKEAVPGGEGDGGGVKEGEEGQEEDEDEEGFEAYTEEVGPSTRRTRSSRRLLSQEANSHPVVTALH